MRTPCMSCCQCHALLYMYVYEAYLIVHIQQCQVITSYSEEVGTSIVRQQCPILEENHRSEAGNRPRHSQWGHNVAMTLSWPTCRWWHCNALRSFDVIVFWLFPFLSCQLWENHSSPRDTKECAHGGCTGWTDSMGQMWSKPAVLWSMRRDASKHWSSQFTQLLDHLHAPAAVHEQLVKLITDSNWEITTGQYEQILSKLTHYSHKSSLCTIQSGTLLKDASELRTPPKPGHLTKLQLRTNMHYSLPEMRTPPQSGHILGAQECHLTVVVL